MKKIIRVLTMFCLVWSLISINVMATSDDWSSLEKQYLNRTSEYIGDVVAEISAYVVTLKAGMSNGGSVGTSMANTAYNSVQADVSKLTGYLNNLESYVEENKDIVYADNDGTHYLKQTHKDMGKYALQLGSYTFSSLSDGYALEQYSNASTELLYYSMLLSSIAEKGVVVSSGSSDTDNSLGTGGDTSQLGGTGETLSEAIILQDDAWYTKVWTSKNYKSSCYNKIEVSERGYITFSISKANGTRLSFYELFLYDAEGKQIWEAGTYAIKNSFGDYYEYKIGLDKGTYYMNIDPSGYVNEDTPVTTKHKYVFTKNDYWEIESNNDLSKATEVSLNTEYRGTYCDEAASMGRNDYFKFYLTEGRPYKFYVYNYAEVSAGTTIMELFDASNNKIRISERDGKDSGTAKYWTFTAEQTGWYSFVARNNSGKVGIEYGIKMEQQKIQISDCTVSLSATEYNYDGKIKKPTVIVKDSKGKALKQDTDYTVTYANGAKNVGNYKVTVKMQGDYEGSKKLAFKINPAATKLSKLVPGKKSMKVTVAKKNKQVSGYQIQYATSKKFTKAKIQTIASYKKTKCTILKLKAKKKYYVRVRTYKTVGKTKYYSTWSAHKSVKTK